MATIQNGHISPHTNFNHFHFLHSVMDLINASPGNSSVNTVQHATIEEMCCLQIRPKRQQIGWIAIM
jgi:hypothetical protein